MEVCVLMCYVLVNVTYPKQGFAEEMPFHTDFRIYEDVYIYILYVYITYT